MNPRLFVALWILAFSPLSFAASGSGQRVRGAEVFTTNGCLHCHRIGSAGGQRGPNLSDVGRRRSKAMMRWQIVHGSKAMPAYGDVLTRSQIDDLIAYLRSCRSRIAPDRGRASRVNSPARIPGP